MSNDKKMVWQRLTKENEPDREVLAGNFQPGTYGYKEKIVGYIGEMEGGGWQAESGGEVLENVTHFIPINDFDPEPEAGKDE